MPARRSNACSATVYVRANGARYVKPDELLRSARGKAAVQAVNDLMQEKLSAREREGSARTDDSRPDE